MNFLSLFLFVIYCFFFCIAVIQETTFLMVFSLIVVFFIASFLVISWGFEFLGYLILIVYVGAIAVLFVFMVMLFDRAEYKLFKIEARSAATTKFQILLGSIISSLCMAFIFYFLCFPKYDSFSDFNYNFIESFYNLKPAELEYYKWLSGETVSADEFIPRYSDIELLGITLYSDYYVAVILAGLGLLVSMIGCILVTRSSILKNSMRKTQKIENQLSRYKI